MAIAPQAAQRLLRGATATLDVTLYDQNGDPADAAGTVTVGITKADGSEVLASGSSTTNPTGTGTYQRSLTAAQTATLELLTAIWTDGGDASTHTTLHEIVGGFYANDPDIRAFDTSLAEAGTYPAELLRRVRQEAEDECERITGTAWVPRYRRARFDGSGTSDLVVPTWRPRTVRSVRVYADATTYTAFTSGELQAIETLEHGVLTRRDGNTWTAGIQNVVVEWEHGYDRPPEDLRHAVLSRIRYRANMELVGLSESATRLVLADGSSYELPDSNEALEQRAVLRAYHRWAVRTPGLA